MCLARICMGCVWLTRACVYGQVPPLYGGTNQDVPSPMKKYFGVEPDPPGFTQSSLPVDGMYDKFDVSLAFEPASLTGDDLNDENWDEHARLSQGSTTGSTSSHHSTDFHSARNSPTPSIDLEHGVPDPESFPVPKTSYYTKCCLITPPLRLCFDKNGTSHVGNRLRLKPLGTLCLYADVANAVLCCMSVGLIVTVSIFLASERWEEGTGADVIDEMFWVSIVTVVLAAMLLVTGFIGILSVHSQNFHLLKFHQLTLNSITVFLTLTSITAIVYGTNLNSIINAEVLSVSEGARGWFVGMHLAIAGCTGGMALFSFVPGLFCATLRIRFKMIMENAARQGITDVFYRSNMQRIKQLRMVLRSTNMIALFFALCCIVFGFYGVRQGLKYDLDFTVYVPFLLEELGLVLVIMSMVAFWAAGSKEPNVFRTYEFLSVPFICTMVALCILSFFQVHSIDGYGSVGEDKRTEEEAHLIAAKVKATVVVSGVLEAVTAFFYLQVSHTRAPHARATHTLTSGAARKMAV